MGFELKEMNNAQQKEISQMRKILIIFLVLIFVLALFIVIFKVFKAPAAGGSVTLDSQADWQAGTYGSGIDLTSSPGDVKLNLDWSEATPSAGWSTRYYSTSVVYDNKMWLLGGVGIGGKKNDVWWSIDGINWTQATAAAGWNARESHAAIVYNSKMWVLGGDDASGTRKNDVWWSVDGINWTQATAAAGWGVREGHTALVYDGKMWIMGGECGVMCLRRDVWWSVDGINWTQATAAAGWSARRSHASVAYDSKIWVLGGDNIDVGGTRKNDVWWSVDGINWTQATAAAGWSARNNHTSVVYDSKMWVLGGMIGGAQYEADVWYSTDGVSWIQVDSAVGWSERARHTSLVFDNKMWVLGGYGSTGAKGDVWYKEYAATSQTHTSAATQIDGGTDIGGWTTFEPTATIPANTAVSFRFRTSNDGAAWSSWSGSYSYAASIDISSLAAQRYLQVETTLSNTEGLSTPTLSSYKASFNTSSGTPTPSTPTPTPSTQSPIPSPTPTPTPTSSRSPTYSYVPHPSTTWDAVVVDIIKIRDNVLNKEYQVRDFGLEDFITVCDKKPTFSGSGIYLMKVYLYIFAENSARYLIEGEASFENGNLWYYTVGQELPYGKYKAVASYTTYAQNHGIFFGLGSGPANLEVSDCSGGGKKIERKEEDKFRTIADLLIKYTEKSKLYNPFLISLFLLLLILFSLLDPYVSSSAFILQLRYNFLEIFGIRKKGKRWGIVYDYLTKKPLKLVVVRLVEKNSGRVRETYITGKNGIYSFAPDKGDYLLRAYRANYIFPPESLKVADVKIWRGKENDGVYKNIYTGGIVTIKESEGLVSCNLPLEFSGKTVYVSQRQKIIAAIVRFLNKIRIPLLIIGSLIAVAALILFAGLIDIVVFSLYLAFWVIEILRAILVFNPCGRVMIKETGEPLPLSIVRLIATKETKDVILYSKVTDTKGRYNILVSPGKYRLTIEKAGFKPYDTGIFEIKRERFIDFDIKLVVKT